MNRILVLSPHPDDETLGCGGALRRHVEMGDLVQVIFLTSGERGNQRQAPAEAGRVREQEARRATRILGIHEIEFWREPDSALRVRDAVVERLRGKWRSWRPTLLYAPHEHEMHPDHRAAFRILRGALMETAAAQRPLVRLYEVWTPIRKMDEIVDISPFMATKLRAIRAYQSQSSAMSFADAIRGLNRYRGEMHSWPGGDYAEVFAKIRIRKDQS